MRKDRTSLYYWLSLVLAGVFLGLLFMAFYDYVNDPGPDKALALKTAYGYMVCALAVLLAQAFLVHRNLLQPLAGDERKITELTSRLRQMSTLDELTKTYNRNAFDYMLLRELDHVRQRGIDVCAVMFDVDGFRALNDAHGYHTGDRVLAELAQAVKQSVRGTDVLFRWRGGKFIVLAPHTGLRNAATFGEKIRRMVEETEFAGVHLTVSLGAASLLPSDSPDTFVARIKSALESAKAKGCNNLQLVPSVA